MNHKLQARGNKAFAPCWRRWLFTAEERGCFFATLRASSLVAQKLPWERRRRVWSGFVVSWPFWDWMRRLWLAVLWRNKAAVGDCVLGAIVFVCSSLRSRFSMITSHFFFLTICLFYMWTWTGSWGNHCLLLNSGSSIPHVPSRRPFRVGSQSFHRLASLIPATKGRPCCLAVTEEVTAWVRCAVVVAASKPMVFSCLKKWAHQRLSFFLSLSLCILSYWFCFV